MCVTEFVQQHARKQCDEEAYTRQGCGQFARLHPVAQADEAEQQQEREVHIHVDAEEFSDLDGPFHR